MNLNDIVVKMEYFPRINLDEETVARYMELYELGEVLPPIVVQKEKHILIDGFHRLEAQKRLGWTEIGVEFIDIPEDKIYLTSIRLNRKHGRAFSIEDRNEQIRRLRFENDPPLTYEEIGKEVLLSTSRVGEICRGMEFNINGTIIPNVDGRRSITPDETEEIQDRLEAGEPPSEIAKDYPVSVSRVSQLKKPKIKKRQRIKKSRPSRKGEPAPVAFTIHSLKRRFKKLNPEKDDADEIDWDSIDSTISYKGVLEDMAIEYPDYNWFSYEEIYGEELASLPFDLHENDFNIKLKVHWIKGGKYAQVRGQIPKKILDHVRDRISEEMMIQWPLIEPDKRVFSYLNDEELSELYEKSHLYEREPEDEEMKMFLDLIPEK